jgi:hypothetical protein
MVQLRETLDIIDKNYKFINLHDYLAIVNRSVFFQNAIDGHDKGTFTMG